MSFTIKKETDVVVVDVEGQLIVGNRQELKQKVLEQLENGDRLLPVENTSASVDLDLIGNTMRLPQRQRLSLILNELGVGLAGRGRDLNEVIRRANPALKETDEVLAILARQNTVLEQLAVNSDTVLQPLARDRAPTLGPEVSIAIVVVDHASGEHRGSHQRLRQQRAAELL